MFYFNFVQYEIFVSVNVEGTVKMLLLIKRFLHESVCVLRAVPLPVNEGRSGIVCTNGIYHWV